jgi:hypothetical protein
MAFFPFQFDLLETSYCQIWPFLIFLGPDNPVNDRP